MKLIPITQGLENKEFIYNDLEEKILCLDQIWLYCLVIGEAKLYHCKTTTTGSYVCTQSDAVMCGDWQGT